MDMDAGMDGADCRDKISPGDVYILTTPVILSRPQWSPCVRRKWHYAIKLRCRAGRTGAWAVQMRALRGMEWNEERRVHHAVCQHAFSAGA